jgi:hypothetical protein
LRNKQNNYYQQNIAFEPIEYIATTGWTTLNLESAIHAQNPMNNYTIVSLLIGVNDQYQTHDTTFTELDLLTYC